MNSAGWVRSARRYFRDEGGDLTVDTPEARLNEMVNSALKKEIMWSTRLWRNGISTPWRNELQDALGYALWNPEAAYSYLEAVTAVQKPSGYLQVWNTRSGENPNHPLVSSRHTDGGIWLILCWVLFHDGDWTDPMNGPGREGRGESGWATEALIVALAELGSVVRLLEGDTPEGAALASELDQGVRELHESLVATLWDGRQFAAGTDDEGRRFGDSADGRTFLNPQSWGIMAEYAAGAAGQERIAGCTAAIASLALAGDTAASLDIVMRTLPGHQDHLRAAPDVPQQLPLYQSNSYFYHPGHPQCGTSTGTLGTGTCSWIVLTVFLQYFGLSFEPQGLRVAPRLPPAWPRASISFLRRGTKYTVHVVRDDADPAQLDPVNTSACIHITPGHRHHLTIVVTPPREASLRRAPPPTGECRSF